ncbi:unnamed protein product [Plutella xylostella]|uniref:(diamondback moth) hypothetical protein n=1 Tax=Plutella xylostella TaxID=51655 RepID=A0A8S4GCI0_PLUXY|nr:organic cation transporter protein [Plutella xylostella]XP_037969223.1 organic cation transporter protein [Plutella xylostella]CAG9136522.1 unnamed protein product [Plutella xylostella]
MTASHKETKTTMAEDKPELGFNLDGILAELGSFGKYQLLLLLLLAFRDSFLAMCNFHFVFTVAEVNYRCHVPECEYFNNSRYNATWSHFALPETGVCHRMVPYNESAGNMSVLMQHWNASSEIWTQEKCTSRMFSEEETMPCRDLVYEDYNSMVAEFDLGCQPWKKTLVGTVHNLGLILSFVISGFISDRYGRKVIIVGTPLMVGVCGLLKSYSVDYWMLLVLEFLEASLGYGNASLVLSLEAVNQNNRVIYSCISDSLANFGAAFFGLIAWKVPYWRYMMRTIYAPLLIVVFYIFLVDEGVRWLFANKREDEAVKIVHKVAKVNNVTLSYKAQDMLTKIKEEKSKADQDLEKPSQETMSIIFSDLRSRTILLRVVLIAACFFCTMFIYNGAILNAVHVSGNKYLNYSAMMLVAIPVRVITALTFAKFGRKAPICVAYCFCSVFFIASAFVPKSLSWASILLYVVAKMGSSYGMFAMFVVAVEVFPTTSRNSMVNIAQTVGRLGSVLAPQTPLLTKYMDGLPSVVFGVVALGPCLLSFFLPDTSKASLPDDVRAAESLDHTLSSDTQAVDKDMQKEQV